MAESDINKAENTKGWFLNTIETPYELITDDDIKEGYKEFVPNSNEFLWGLMNKANFGIHHGASCECGACTGNDIEGFTCPECHTEVTPGEDNLSSARMELPLPHCGGREKLVAEFLGLTLVKGSDLYRNISAVDLVTGIEKGIFSMVMDPNNHPTPQLVPTFMAKEEIFEARKKGTPVKDIPVYGTGARMLKNLLANADWPLIVQQLSEKVLDQSSILNRKEPRSNIHPNSRFCGIIGDDSIDQEKSFSIAAIAKRLTDMGYTIRTGGRAGTELASMGQADKSKFQVHITYPNFQKIALDDAGISETNRFVYSKIRTPKSDAEIKAAFPSTMVTESKKYAIARNYCLINGIPGEDNNEFLVCHTANAEGRDPAIQMAERKGIPVFDIADNQQAMLLDLYLNARENNAPVDDIVKKLAVARVNPKEKIKASNKIAELIAARNIAITMWEENQSPAELMLSYLLVLSPAFRPINEKDSSSSIGEINEALVDIISIKKALEQNIALGQQTTSQTSDLLKRYYEALRNYTDLVYAYNSVKKGYINREIWGASIDHAARGVATPDTSIDTSHIGIPRKMLIGMYEEQIVNKLVEIGYDKEYAKELVDKNDDKAAQICRDLTKDLVILTNRQPTLHRHGIISFHPIMIEDANAIVVNPLVCEMFNLDFDGDALLVMPLFDAASSADAMEKDGFGTHLRSSANNMLISVPKETVRLGIMNLTKEKNDNAFKYDVYVSDILRNELDPAQQKRVFVNVQRLIKELGDKEPKEMFYKKGQLVADGFVAPCNGAVKKTENGYVFVSFETDKMEIPAGSELLVKKGDVLKTGAKVFNPVVKEFDDYSLILQGLEDQTLSMSEPIVFKQDDTVLHTTPGRFYLSIALSELLPNDESFEFINYPLETKKELDSFVDAYDAKITKAFTSGIDRNDPDYDEKIRQATADATAVMVKFREVLQAAGLKSAEYEGTFTYSDLPSFDTSALYKQIYEKLDYHSDNYTEQLLETAKKLLDKNSENVKNYLKEIEKKNTCTINDMIRSDAKGSVTNILNYVMGKLASGISNDQYFVLGVRDSFAMVSLADKAAGVTANNKGINAAEIGTLENYLAKALSTVLVTEDDCGTSISQTVNRSDNWDGILLSSYLAEDVVDSEKNLIARKGDLVDRDLLARLNDSDVETVKRRYSVGCTCSSGICKHCYGAEVSQNKPVEIGFPAGFSGVGPLIERIQQNGMRANKTGGADGSGVQTVKEAIMTIMNGFSTEAWAKTKEGPMAVAEELSNEIRNCFLSQGIGVNPKYCELVGRAMSSAVLLEDVGSYPAMTTLSCAEYVKFVNSQDFAEYQRDNPYSPMPNMATKISSIKNVVLEGSSFINAEALRVPLNSLFQTIKTTDTKISQKALESSARKQNTADFKRRS